MSVLAGVCRAGSSQQNGLVRGLVFKDIRGAIRYKGTAPKNKGVPSQPGYLKKVDGNKSKRRKSMPIFQTLPASLRAMFQTPETTPKTTRSAWDPANFLKPEAVGQTAQFSNQKSDPLRVYGLPRKIYLEFRLLSKPTNVIREVTATTLELLNNQQHSPSSNSRLVFTGKAGSGKSFLMLQAVDYCVSQNWVVIYIPRANRLVNSTTSYTYDLRTQTYLQPAFAFQILQRMLTVNAHLLEKIRLVDELPLDKQVVPAHTPLSTVIDIAIKERVRTTAQSPLILDAVMRSLEVQTKYPVLFAVDDFQALYCKSTYKDPHFQPIATYHLSMPRLIMEYASGRRSFAKGAFIGAISRSDTNFPLPIELRDALGLEHDHPVSPYDKRRAELLAYAQGLKPLAVPDKLTLQEAAAIFEVWKNAQTLSGKTYDETFLSKYVESSGNPRDFVWKGLLATLGN